MNTLAILGLWLLAPAIIITLVFSIIQIAQEVKDPLDFLLVIVAISAVSGMTLLLLSASY